MPMERKKNLILMGLLNDHTDKVMLYARAACELLAFEYENVKKQRPCGRYVVGFGC
jgi:hypothetical protein